MTDRDECAQILSYLHGSYRQNQEAQVPSVELERELELSPDAVRQCLEHLSAAGIVEADLFPVNVWASLTDYGVRIAEQQG